MQDLVRPHLADVLVDLCETHPLSSITVAQLIDAAHISRRTFYNYFPNIEDLVGYTATRPLLTGKQSFASIENHLLFYDEAKKHQGFYSQLPNYTVGKRSFVQIYTEWFQHCYRLIFVDESLPKNVQVYYASLVDIFVAGAVQFSFKWLASGMLMDPSDLLRIIFDAAPDFIRARVTHAPTVPLDYLHSNLRE